MQLTASIDDGGWAKRFAQFTARDLDTAIRRSVTEVALRGKNEVVGRQGLSKYPRHKAGTPTSSPPGEPPAQVSTALRKSIKNEPAVRVGFGSYTASVAAAMEYARAQEFGIPGRLPARPFMQPAYDRLFGSGDAERIFDNRMTKELDKLRGI